MAIFFVDFKECLVLITNYIYLKGQFTSMGEVVFWYSKGSLTQTEYTIDKICIRLPEDSHQPHLLILGHNCIYFTSQRPAEKNSMMMEVVQYHPLALVSLYVSVNRM